MHIQFFFFFCLAFISQVISFLLPVLMCILRDKRKGDKMAMHLSFCACLFKECLLTAGRQVHRRQGTLGHRVRVFVWVHGRSFLIFIIISGYCSTYCVCTLNKINVYNSTVYMVLNILLHRMIGWKIPFVHLSSSICIVVYIAQILKIMVLYPPNQ